MNKEKKLQLMDIIVFILIIMITIITICNDRISGMIDAYFLPEERNKAYYDIMNNPLKLYESKELAENGTKNLLANYLRSGDRDLGYSITVNEDGTFVFSGNYSGANNIYEIITPIGIGFDLPSGDYVLSDGGASSESGVSIQLTGVKRMIGGGTEAVPIASLPGTASFHWDRDSDIEIYCEMVVRSGASAESLKFSPMLLKTEDSVDQEYLPCLTTQYDWEENELDGVKVYKYDIYKGAMDGELITKNDWNIFLNSIKFQMQADRAVIDLKDGYGIDIRKNDYPMATYGKLNVSMTISDGQLINIVDYDRIISVINSNSGSRAIKVKITANEENNEESIAVQKNEFGPTATLELQGIRDFYSYLKMLDSENYTILLAIKDEGVDALNRETMELLCRLGIKTNLIDNEKSNINNKKYYGYSFCSVLRQREAEVEKLGEEKLTISGKFSDGKDYVIDSAGLKTEEANATIRIGENEYSMNLRGINFVIYDENQHSVVDSVCFDTNSGLLCHRQARK